MPPKAQHRCQHCSVPVSTQCNQVQQVLLLLLSLPRTPRTRTMENPEGQPQPPVMMSLLDKYSNMDTKMDQVRQETAEVELEIQRRQTNTEELLEEREHMKTLQERTLQQQRDLTNEAEKAILKLHEVAEERAQAETKRDEAQARLDRIKKRSNEYREQFLHSSRTFRSQCKRRKMTSQTLGVPNEALAAYSYVTWPQLVQAFEEPEDGRDASDELKYSQTKDKFRELEKSHAESKRECDEWMAKKEGLAERANKRKTQKANLQAQLNRLLQDIRNIQGQLQVARTEASERSNDLVQAPITGSWKILLFCISIWYCQHVV